MKNFLKILLLLFITAFSVTNTTNATEDTDGDRIIDELDTQNTYYNVIDNHLHKYFLYDFSKDISTTSNNAIITNIIAINKDNKVVYLDNSERKYISFNEIWSSRVDAFKNKQDYFYINTNENRNLINEKEVIKYVCNQLDLEENKYSCEWLGAFSEIKFKATSQLDSDNDGINDFDTNWNKLDLEETDPDNIRFVCTLKDIEKQNDTYTDWTNIPETIGYGCENSQLWKFSETKKSYFIDTDRDGINDYLDNDNNTNSNDIKFICNPKDIENNNDSYPNWDPILETNWYSCKTSQLWSFSQIKYSYFNDTDNDWISDYLDNDNNTNSNDIKAICTESNIKNNQYNCTNNQLWSFSQTKFDNLNDADNDGISDFLDSDDSTSSDDSKYVCSSFDIEAGRYGCTSGSLWKVSQSKKDDSINLNSVSGNDNDLFGLEKWQSQSQSDLNLQTWGNKNNWIADNEKLDNLNWNSDIKVSQTWAIWIKNTLVRIAKDLKNLFFFVASIYLLILILKVLVGDKTEEASNNLKKWGLWITIWLVITQVAYAFVMILFDKWVSENLAEEFAQQLFSPFIGLLETAASFFFIIVAFYAFFKLVTAHWNEEAVKAGKMSIIYAIMWFIIVKITKILVNSIYWKVNCSESSLTDIIKSSTGDKPQCLQPADLDWFAKLIVDVINWANGFIWIILVVLIIYTWAKILLSAWNEDTLKSSKSTFLYIAIWVWLLVMNYLILTFFLIPEAPIS